jgi:triacylglycerol lipase
MTLTRDQISTAADMALLVYQDPSDWITYRDGFTTYIAVEGSDELADWRRNAEFLITSSSEHLGFGAYARELMAQMWIARVEIDPNQDTIICGHSLGGAVATIMAAQLQDQLPLLQLVTFGSPRPGGRRFKQRLRVPHYRFVHANDVVPTMPMAACGFRHTCPATQLGARRWLRQLDGVHDHDMHIYRKLVNETPPV